MSDEARGHYRAVADYFGFPDAAAVAKDFHVVRAIVALVAVEAAPFRLVFGGGTALARAHRLIRRMSEDVDFKVVPMPTAPVSRSGLRRQLGELRLSVSEALQGAGFAVDGSNSGVSYAMDSNRYMMWQLPYDAVGSGQGLRPTIKVELNYVALRAPPVMLPVQSFVTEASRRAPEVAQMPCVSVVETAAEKLISLTRRTAMELAGAGGAPDETLVRHIYDLHMLRDLIDQDTIASLARSIAEADSVEFANQFPAYAADIDGETRKALDALRTGPEHRARYESFVLSMVYGERPDFDMAFRSVADLAEVMLRAAH